MAASKDESAVVKCEHGVKEEEELCCPVCFCTLPSSNSKSTSGTSATVLTISKCGHVACQSCIERILLFSHSNNINRIEDDTTALFSCPTIGGCPMCRSTISLFELKDVVSGQEIYEKDTNARHWPMAGLSYTDKNGHTADGDMYHFPYGEPALKNESLSSLDEHDLPYFSFSRQTDDARGATRVDKYFNAGCHYHAKSNTFHGILDWKKDNDDDDGLTIAQHGIYSKWQVIMQFTSDFNYICRGAVIKRPSSSSYDSSCNTTYPLDGTWHVHWENGTNARIHVVGHRFTLFEVSYSLDVSTESKSVTFVWPGNYNNGDHSEPIVQRVLAGLDLLEEPLGPSVGATVTWTTNFDGYKTIVWTRETIGGTPPPIVTLFNSSNNLFKCCRSSPTTAAPTYHAESVWGNVFIQGFKVGMASYHFQSDVAKGVYISYEHPECSQWPPLDNGSPVPTVVPFEQCSWDPLTRTFCGVIEWEAMFQTSWQGAKAWRYEMVFDSEFTSILSGRVLTVGQNGDCTESGVYGESLLYVNAALGQKFSAILQSPQRNHDDRFDSTTDQVDDDDSNGNDPNDARLVYVGNALQRRLQREGASTGIIMMQRLLLFAASGLTPNPIDFSL